MSSPDGSHGAHLGQRTIRVAPREIVDLVTRILRISGVDPATAADTATDVMRCAAGGHGAIEAVLAACDDGTVASLIPPHGRLDTPLDSLAIAHRSGIEIDEDRFRSLERAAAGFLVAERTLDAIADDPTVD